ncbi:MAG TPA: hypothetical protein VFQ61_29055, partial [Polyangiaceae bacterium]|nr:hypothetical protein [Polyangiaceae bacterium]
MPPRSLRIRELPDRRHWLESLWGQARIGLRGLSRPIQVMATLVQLGWLQLSWVQLGCAGASAPGTEAAGRQLRGHSDPMNIGPKDGDRTSAIASAQGSNAAESTSGRAAPPSSPELPSAASQEPTVAPPDATPAQASASIPFSIEERDELGRLPRPSGGMAASEFDVELERWNAGGNSEPTRPSSRPSYHPATRVLVEIGALSRRLVSA